MSTVNSKNYTCVLCDDFCTGYGNNTSPLAEGLCCDDCNIDMIFARINNLSEPEEEPQDEIEDESEEHMDADATEMPNEGSAQAKVRLVKITKMDLLSYSV